MKSYYLPDFVAFFLGIGIAYFLEWQSVDLVWSLWLCSLFVGWSTMILALIGMGLNMTKTLPLEDDPSSGKTSQSLMLWFIMGGVGLFFLSFFSLHFGAFHAGHAVFLQSFFPLETIAQGSEDTKSFDVFSKAFMNPFALFSAAFTYVFPLYGIFLIPAFIAERHNLLRFISRPQHEERVIHINDDDPSKEKAENTKAVKEKLNIGQAFGRPYINVVRMHMLIFFFAGAHMLQLDNFIIYAVIYAVYFFPWRALKKEAVKN